MKFDLSTRSRRRWVLFAGVAALLVVAAVTVAVAEMVHRERRYRFAVRDLLPVESVVLGWRKEPVEITAQRLKIERDMLRYDDAVTIRYVRGSQSIMIYVGYWTPGKMPSRLIASHTPDVCWESQGWNCQYAAEATDLTTRGGAAIAAAQYRVMKHSGFGLTEHVLYWHHVGGRVRFFGSPLPRALLFLTSDLFERGLNLREEQIFVRVSGNMPLDELRRCEPFIEMFERMQFLVDGAR